MNQHRKAVLVILDGFGIGDDSPYNAIQSALKKGDMPFYQKLIQTYPRSQVLTHGGAVGLPDGVMGNSEVGHMAMGSGRVIYQDLVRINQSIQDRTLEKNPVFLKAIEAISQDSSQTLHLMGLLSDGGVHSHIDHLLGLLDACQTLNVPQVSVHAFLDGRDTPPDSAPQYIEKLLRHPSFQRDSGSRTQATLTSISGRYWAMDRDERWDRTEKTLACLTGKSEIVSQSPQEVVEHFYQNSGSHSPSDEFVPPTLFHSDGRIKDGDSILFFNFRADRARQITQKLTSGEWIRPGYFACMTEYDSQYALPVLFPSETPKQILTDCLEEHGLKQFRIAETEKYAHVTFFFNGGREDLSQGEDRVLIPSPKDVATYDLKPEMSAPEVATEAAKKIQSQEYDFVLMNFANGDMVGHTGNFDASLKAMKTLDGCLEKVISAAEHQGYHTLVTADHGNAEEMQDCKGRPHTQHTLNPVPAIWIPPHSALAPKKDRPALKDGSLSDIMPTLCELMNIPQPEESTGKSLLPNGWRS